MKGLQLKIRADRVGCDKMPHFVSIFRDFQKSQLLKIKALAERHILDLPSFDTVLIGNMPNARKLASHGAMLHFESR